MSGVIHELRLRKTAAEIESLRRAAALSARGAPRRDARGAARHEASTRSRPSSNTCAGAAARRASAIRASSAPARTRPILHYTDERRRDPGRRPPPRRRGLRGRLLHGRHHADLARVRAVHAAAARALRDRARGAARCDRRVPARAHHAGRPRRSRSAVLVDGMLRVGLLRGEAGGDHREPEARAVLHAQDEPLARARRPRRRPIRAQERAASRSSPITCSPSSRGSTSPPTTPRRLRSSAASGSGSRTTSSSRPGRPTSSPPPRRSPSPTSSASARARLALPAFS